MFSSSKLISALLVLTVVMLVGMLTASWRLVLYPFQLVIGLSMLFGLSRRLPANKNLIWYPIGVSVLYLILYFWADVITLHSSLGGNGYFLGLVPSTAIYVFGIWPAAILVALIYAWTFPQGESIRDVISQDKSTNLN